MTILAEFGWTGTRYPLAAIQKIGSETGKEKHNRVHLVTLRDRDPIEVAAYDVNRILMTPVQLIPAQPETFMVWCWRQEAEMGHGENPVVAWALCADGRTRPVTAQGVNDGDTDPERDHYVLMPNGSVQCTNEHAEAPFYETITAYLLGEGEKIPAEVGERPF